jgi:uncharacterized nucleotidyltransferase DUF6036
VNRTQLEHVIRAAAAITGDSEIVVVGSQAILGQFPEAPPEMLLSQEADVYPRNHPERAELIEAIGELSTFHDTFGYYADGIAAELPSLPHGWQERLIVVPVGDARGLCLEAHDLALSKCAAGREKDRDFVRAAIRHGLVEREVLLRRLEQMALDPAVRDLVRQRIEAYFSAR